jgi:hypothetical protein
MREQTGHVLEMSDAAMGVAWIGALEAEDIADKWEHFWTSIGKNGSAVNPVTGCRMWPGGHTNKRDTHVPPWIKRYYAEKRREKALKQAAEKFEAAVNGGEVLAIPQRPQEIITAGFAIRIRANLEKMDNIEVIGEQHRRLMALERYVTDRSQEEEVRAAARWCELRLGELLGVTSQGGRTDLQPSPASESLDKDEAYKFRLMAANREIVEARINHGQTSRAAILAEIRRDKANGNGKKPLDVEAVAQNVISFLKRKLEGASDEEIFAVMNSITGAFRTLDTLDHPVKQGVSNSASNGEQSSSLCTKETAKLSKSNRQPLVS